MKCNIHTIEIGKKTYFVIVGTFRYRVMKVFVWRRKHDLFYFPDKIDNLKAEMIENDDQIDLIYWDHRGEKITYPGLSRFCNEPDRAHEKEFNSLLPNLDKAIEFAESLKLKRLEDWKYCVNKVFNLL